MVDQLAPVEGEKYATRYSQAEVNYTPDYQGAEGRCASCRWFIAHSEYGEGCTIVENYPADVLPTGRCDKHEAMPTMKPYVQPVVIVEASAEVGKTPEPLPIPEVTKQQSFLAHWKATIAEALRGKAEMPVAFKVVGNHWFARWSNTFKDRDGEHFATKAHDDYILRVKMGVVPMPRLWVDHIPGSDHGTARVIARIEHFTIAAGDFDDTPKGKAAKAYYAKHAAQGVSHGFAFDKNQLIDGVYNQYNTFEISPLMRKIPANPFTTFEEVQNMKITEQDIKLLNEMFGEDIVTNDIIAKTEQASKALEEAGVAFKDFVDPQPTSVKADEDCMKRYMDEGMSEEDAKAKCMEAKALRGDKALATLVVDMLQDQAGVVTLVDGMGKALKAQDEATTTLIEGFKKDLAEMKAQLDQRPRIASKDSETVVDESKVNAEVVKQAHETKADAFWNPTG